MKARGSQFPILTSSRKSRAAHRNIEALEDRIAPATVFALDNTNHLIVFDSATPGTTSTVTINGLLPGESIVGIDSRPANGLLYALGSLAGVGRLFTLDPNTGNTTLVAALAADPADLTSPYATLNGTEFGFDFNPVADRIRIVSDTNQSLRINPGTGLVTTDGDINPGTPDIVAAAYTNSFAGTASTTLYVVDALSDQLMIQNPPNNGTLTAVGALGINVGTVTGFDLTPGNSALLSATVGGVTSLFSVNLNTGATTPVGVIGTGAIPIRGIAVTGGFGATVSGTTATFGGTSSAENLVITESGGLLQHNRFGVDGSFNSAFDFDSTVAGDQTLAADTNSIINVIGNGGADSVNIDIASGYTVGALNLPGGQVLLTSSAGALATNGSSNIVANTAALKAEAGIGTVGTPLATTVSAIEAETNTGGIFAANSTALTIGGISGNLKGLFVNTSGNIQVSSTGSMTLTDTSGLEGSVRGGSTSGDVILNAIGAGSDFTSIVNFDAVSAPGGSVVVTAGGSFNLGNGAGFDNDVRARNNVTITAGGNFTLQGLSDISSDDSALGNGGSVTITAGGTLDLLGNNGNDASIFANGSGGGDVTLIAGPDALVRVNAGFGTVIFSASGDVRIDGDRFALSGSSSIGAPGGSVTFQPVTAGRDINLGSATDVGANLLELSEVELDRINTPLLRIGNSQSGLITLSTQLTGTSYQTLSLIGAGLIDGTVGEQTDITVGSLAVRTGIGGIGSLDEIDTAVTNLAYANAGGAVNFFNTGDLFITTVDGLTSSTNLGTTTTITAASPITFLVDTFGIGTMTFNALESADPGDNITVEKLISVESATGDVTFNAGDGVVLKNFSAVQADGTVTLNIGVANADNISFADIQGSISGNSVEIVGGTGRDVVNISTVAIIGPQLFNLYLGADAQGDSVVVSGDDLSNLVNVSLQPGNFVSVVGFGPNIRIYNSTTADSLTVAGNGGNDQISASPGLETKIGITLDGGGGNDILIGNGTLIGGDGDDTLTGGTGANILLGDGGGNLLYGLTTNNELVSFSPRNPNAFFTNVAITGLEAGEILVGIDTRPVTGEIIGIGDHNRLYTIDPATGVATFRAALTADPTDLTDPFVGLTGPDFGVDFNPVVDRLRVVSSTGQNLRINVDTGLVLTDVALNPGTPSVASAAYLNNFAGTTTTTLYTIDATTDQLLIQNPPNNGTQVLVGSLGVDASAVSGFEIVPGTNFAYAALTVGGSTRLYTIDLTVGYATEIDPAAANLRGLTAAPGIGNDVILGGDGGDVLVGGLGDDTLDGGDGIDSLVGGGGNDLLTGGIGADLLNGGSGTDRIVETRDANFTLTNTSLLVGADGADTLTSIENVELIGGAGDNIFNVGAFVGGLKLTGGAGSDTLDVSAAALGVTVDLDAIGFAQLLSIGGISLQLNDPAENFVGTGFNDIVSADVQNFTRSLNGGAPSMGPGLPGSPVPPGDQLTIDAKGQFLTIQKSDDNTGTATTPDFATISFDDFETVKRVNSAAAGGFDGGVSGEPSAFNAAVTISTDKYAPLQIAVGDLNGDGFDDIVAVNTGNVISVHLANGDGSFQAPVIYKTGGKGAKAITLGNVDDDSQVLGGDDDLDIIVVNTSSKRVSVLLNDGAGVFGTATSFKVLGGASVVRTGDFNQDGLLDIATLSPSSAAISVLLNSGTGTPGSASFGPLAKILTGGKKATDFVVGDFDGDGGGTLDFAVVHSGTKSLRVLKGSGSGTFTLDPTVYPAGINPTVLAVADFNNDGIDDIAINHKTSRLVSVLAGRGNAGGALFTAALDTGFAITRAADSALVAADFDGDGNADIALTSDNWATVRFGMGTGDGLFLPLKYFSFDAEVTKKMPLTTSFVTGDFNGDGALDLAISNKKTKDISILIRTAV